MHADDAEQIPHRRKLTDSHSVPRMNAGGQPVTAIADSLPFSLPRTPTRPSLPPVLCLLARHAQHVEVQQVAGAWRVLGPVLLDTGIAPRKVQRRAAGDGHQPRTFGSQAREEGVAGRPRLVSQVVELALVGTARPHHANPVVHELPGAVVVHDGHVADVEQVDVIDDGSTHGVLGICKNYISGCHVMNEITQAVVT